MGNYKITPPVGTLHVYVDGRLVKSKVHNTRYNRECYATGMIVKYTDSIIDFVFNDGLREIHMFTYDPKAAIIKRVHEIPSYTKDGIEYFDDAKFCQWYNLGDAIPNKLILQPTSLSLK
jgi:hypothetical protein